MAEQQLTLQSYTHASNKNKQDLHLKNGIKALILIVSGKNIFSDQRNSKSTPEQTVLGWTCTKHNNKPKLTTNHLERMWVSSWPRQNTHTCRLYTSSLKEETTANNRNASHLIVPVGEGTGEAKLESDWGMFIRRGGRTFVLGGLGTRFGVLSLTKEVKRTLTFVEGNRNTQLKENWPHFQWATLSIR